MTGDIPPQWRRLRSAVFAAVATGLAAAGHVVGGGGLPDPAALVPVAGLVGFAVNGLAARRRGVPGIFGVLLVSQVAFHLIFTVVGHDHGPIDLVRMTAFHLVAALLTAIVLARGDATLFSLLAWLSVAVPRMPAAVPVAAAGQTSLAAAAGDVPVLVPGSWSRPICRRGPPAST